MSKIPQDASEATREATHRALLGLTTPADDAAHVAYEDVAALLSKAPEGRPS